MATIMAYCKGSAYRASQTMEAQLLNQYEQGDETAFCELVDRYQSSLCTFLRCFLNRSDLVEDVFQETLLQLYTSRANYDVSRPLRPWLFTIAANKAKDALRRAKRRRTIPISSLQGCDNLSFEDILNSFASRSEDPSARLNQAEMAAHIRRVVGRLPKKQKEILTLAYFDQFTYKQISEIISIPIGTVKSRLHTAVAGFSREWKRFWAHETAVCPTRACP